MVTLLLRLRPAAPLDFIANYFAEVLNGTHVLLRDFAYISACPHNRWSFVLVIQAVPTCCPTSYLGFRSMGLDPALRGLAQCY